MKLLWARPHHTVAKSPSVWRVWIEMVSNASICCFRASHPPCGGCGLKWGESYRMEDRFLSHPPCGGCGLKSLYPRIFSLTPHSHPPCGGCGLKYKSLWHNRTDDMSPSVWRVWIEIDEGKTKAMTIDGHPPCGGCGLKSQIYRGYARGLWSPSVWRVWIEIMQ